MKGARKNSRVLAISLSLLVLSTAAIADHKLQKEERKVVDVNGQTGLVVKNAQGKVIIVGVSDLSQVIITAQKWVRARNSEKAEEIMKDLDFDVDERAEEIRIIARHPEGMENKSVWSIIKGEKLGAYIDFTIEVPQNFNVKAATTSGDVRITNVEGTATVNATSGDVVLREIGGRTVVRLTSGRVDAIDIDGDLEIAASSGDVEVRRIKGALVLEATSGNLQAFEIGGDVLVKLFNGDLDITGCLGDLKFSTSNGDARIIDVLGSIDASTSSGDLDVVIVPVGNKKFFLNTSSGDVELHYLTTREYGFVLDVNTCTGSIRGDLDIKLDKITRQTLKGIVGHNSKSRVIVETASGNVIIREITKKK